MTLPAGVAKVFATFDHMSLRERALLAAAGLVAVVMAWVVMVLDPLTAKQKALQDELASLQQSMQATGATIQAVAERDPNGGVMEQGKQLQERLDAVNTQLASTSAGVIPPALMVKVIHDVLSNQRGITLVSLQNKPVTALVQPATAPSPAAANTPAATVNVGGPYVHRVELVIDGSYLDILSYLRALEALPWRFYWRALQLETTKYPSNRVHIELSTLSLDKEWIGV